MNYYLKTYYSPYPLSKLQILLKILGRVERKVWKIFTIYNKRQTASINTNLAYLSTISIGKVRQY